MPNLVYTDDNSTFRRTVREIENNDMDEGGIDWSHFSNDLLVPSVQMRTARSCAYKCAFCNSNIMGAGKPTSSSAARAPNASEARASLRTRSRSRGPWSGG